jgi:hypothetical protein
MKGDSMSTSAETLDNILWEMDGQARIWNDPEYLQARTKPYGQSYSEGVKAGLAEAAERLRELNDMLKSIMLQPNEPVLFEVADSGFSMNGRVVELVGLSYKLRFGDGSEATISDQHLTRKKV